MPVIRPTVYDLVSVCVFRPILPQKWERHDFSSFLGVCACCLFFTPPGRYANDALRRGGDAIGQDLTVEFE